MRAFCEPRAMSEPLLRVKDLVKQFPVKRVLLSGEVEHVHALDGVVPIAEAPVLREFAVRTPVPAELVVERMAEQGFLAGIALGDEYGEGLLVAVTERRTRAEIDAYAAAFEKVLA